jgi:hypothetical protein
MRNSRLPMLIVLGLGILAPFFTNMDFLNPSGTSWPDKEAVKITPDPIGGSGGPLPTITLRKVNRKAKRDSPATRATTAKITSEERAEADSE